MRTPAVRRAEETDADAVARLLAQLGYTASPDHVRARLRHIAESPADHVLVASTDTAVVGLVSVNIAPLLAERGMFARITALVVGREQRGTASSSRCPQSPRTGDLRLLARSKMCWPTLSSHHYVTGWPRPGDLWVIAEAAEPVGAAWWRYFTERDPGFGFVDPSVPEVSIAVFAQARGVGVGRRLLNRLIAEADVRGLPGLSLSVEADNPARGLYEELGFHVVEEAGALTMRLVLPAEGKNR